MESLIEVQGLSKRFGALTAVDNISFSAQRGDLLGFLGPNGAGKSTTMKMITGFLTPSEGHAVVCGHDVSRQAMKAKAAMGYLPEGAPAYGDMTPLQFLTFCAKTRGITGLEAKKAIDRVIELVQLNEVLNRPVETLSKGYKRRVGIAQAILHDPPVLILDEPTDGLDPNQKHEVRALIAEMAKNKAIIISTHILEEVDALCNRAIIIAQGQLLYDGAPASLEVMSRWHQAVTIRVANQDVAKVNATFAGADYVKTVETIAEEEQRTTLTLFPEGTSAILTPVLAELRDRKIEVDEIIVEKGRLDEVFRRLTLNYEMNRSTEK